MNAKTYTDQQRTLADAAAALLAAIDAVVPTSTAHYAVEGARRAASVLAAQTHTVQTRDYRAEAGR